MVIWHLFFIYRKSENNALEPLIFYSEYSSKSYWDTNVGSLKNKQDSLSVTLVSALAASPEVAPATAHFLQLPEVGMVRPPYYVSCLIPHSPQGRGMRSPPSCNALTSMGWNLLFLHCFLFSSYNVCLRSQVGSLFWQEFLHPHTCPYLQSPYLTPLSKGKEQLNESSGSDGLMNGECMLKLVEKWEPVRIGMG
jgi:hypothetical protein